MTHALYWDESDEHDPSYEKIRRALYATLEEAKAQAMHDLLCLRCRVLDERGRPTLESTGRDPLRDGEPCPDCGGSMYTPSRRILCIEELDDEETQAYHVDAKRRAGDERAVPPLNRGKVVWEP